jgi:hypothetical protein
MVVNPRKKVVLKLHYLIKHSVIKKKFKGHKNVSVEAGNRNRNSDLRLRLAGAGAERNTGVCTDRCSYRRRVTILCIVYACQCVLLVSASGDSCTVSFRRRKKQRKVYRFFAELGFYGSAPVPALGGTKILWLFSCSRLSGTKILWLFSCSHLSGTKISLALLLFPP